MHVYCRHYIQSTLTIIFNINNDAAGIYDIIPPVNHSLSSIIHVQVLCISQSIQSIQFTSSTKLIHMQTLEVSNGLLTKTNMAAARVNLDWTTSHKEEFLQTTGAGFFIHQIPFLSPNQQCQNTQENQRGSFNTTSYKLS